MRFYFDFENGFEIIRDDTGVEAEDLDQALDEARSAIEEMADELKGDALGDAPVLMVRDGTGSSVARVPIQEVLDRFSSLERGNAKSLSGGHH